MADTFKVAVRCRPMSGKETTAGSRSIIQVSEGKAVQCSHPKNPQDVKAFTFDFAYDHTSSQVQVYEDLGKPLLMKALDGFNGTVFAYGQTGSGKTHTMMGTGSDVGLIPKLITSLFEEIAERTTEQTKFLLQVSYLELYNEVIHDLLNPKERELKIRQNPAQGIYVDGLCELITQTESDLIRLLDQGNAVRKVAATNMNDRSSRSHSVFTIRIEQKTVRTEGSVSKETSLNAKLNLVDLAGSERAAKTGATGGTLKEGAAINYSLMVLGKVINALTEGSSGHIPYRESQLTRLLEESLGGNALTTMMAAISPAESNYDETLGTLNYARRAKTIKNEVKRNEDVNEKMLRELKSEIEKLRQQIQGGAMALSPGGNRIEPDEAYEKRLEELERAKQQSWEEKEKLSKQLEKERAENMNTAFAGIVDSVKAKKLEMIKTIKRLKNAKTSLINEQTKKRTDYEDLKATVTKDMQRYQALQTEAEATSDPTRQNRIEAAMAQLIQKIEQDRGTIQVIIRELTRVKNELKIIEEDLDEKLADFEANKNILEENDKLKQAVIAEERAKWEAAKEELLAKELQEERSRVNDEKSGLKKSIENYKEEIDRILGREKMLQERIVQLEKEREENHQRVIILDNEKMALEEKVGVYEVDLETAQAQIERLRIEASNQIEQIRQKEFAQREVESQQKVKDVSEHEYTMFKDLMNIFREEQNKMEAKYRETNALLRRALEDILFLTSENEDLRAQLEHAKTWEPTIC